METPAAAPTTPTPARVRVASAEFVLGAPRVEVLPPAGPPELAFIGRSNVGKSSLLNFLTGKHRLARVSNTPGATRQLNVFNVELVRAMDRRKIRLVDLPGYGWAKLPAAEKAALSRTLTAYAHAERGSRVAVLLLDIRRDPSEDDLRMHDLLLDAQVPTLLVVTKADKVGKAKRMQEVARIARAVRRKPAELVLTSVDAEMGRDQVWNRAWTALFPREGD